VLRITSGIHRGRLLKVPKHCVLRPTQARLRQAWLNSVQNTLPDSKVLDLFAGSGALGFEALSRGAREILFLEKSPHATRCILENARTLKAESSIRVINKDITHSESLVIKEAPFDLVFADPPYEEGWEIKLLQWPWSQILAETGMLCIEWSALKSPVSELPEQVNGLLRVREKDYGDTTLTTYERS
jgi:16S rRNA (guanine966-N2)-methyltransferase